MPEINLPITLNKWQWRAKDFPYCLQHIQLQKNAEIHNLALNPGLLVAG